MKIVFGSVILAVVAGCTATRESQDSTTVRIAVSEGTTLALDLSRNDSSLVFDLLGDIWVLPANGGEARAITNAIRDTADQAWPSFSPDGRAVVFSGERGGRAGLWVVEVESGQTRRLTIPPLTDAEPAWSPDGSRIAFIRQVVRMRGERPQGFEGLHLVDAATDSVRAIPLGDSGTTTVHHPAWSPDGRKIYVTAPRSGPSGGPVIWEVDLATGTTRTLIASFPGASVPSPSPDSRLVGFFAPDSAGRIQIWIHDLHARTNRRVTDLSEITPQSLRWSQAATTLFFVSEGRLRKLDISSGQVAEIPFVARLEFARARPALAQRRFAAPGARLPARGQFGLALSPSGKQIATLALGKLWIGPVSGAPREVTSVPPTARDVEWSPDEARVVFSVGAWGSEDIQIVELATGRIRALTALPGQELVPRWSPDGGWIAFVLEQPDSGQRLLVAPSDAPTIRRRSEAKDLGPAYFSEWAIGIGRTTAPAWRPDSRGLLVHYMPPGPALREPFGFLRDPVGEVVSLEGKRQRLARFPRKPTDTRWIDDTTLVYLQGDRIWKARFSGDSGIAGEPEALNQDPALYLSAARTGALLYVSGDGLRLSDPGGAVTPLGWPLTYQVPIPPAVLIRNAKVLDGSGSPVTGPRDLLIHGGRIDRIAPAGSLDSSGAQVIDATGSVVMPGLADLHFHYDGPAQLRGQLYYGVTVVRDQGSDIGTLAAMAEGGASGAWPAPRISFGGFQVYSDWAFSNGLEQGLEPEQDAGHLARVVALLTAHGAEHMKIRTFHGWPVAARLVDAAHRAGLRTTGHCVLPLTLLAVGMDAQEHLGNNCGTRLDAPLRDDVQQLYHAAGISIVPSTMMYSWWGEWARNRRILERDDIAPFLVPIRKNGLDWLADDNLKYLVEEQGQLMLRQARALHGAGVPLGLGADAPMLPWAVHLELERLVEAGLTPLEAIRAGTEISARIIGHDGESGTITPGKLADLILLEPGADPSIDIRATRRIRQVILAGKPLDREALRTPDGVAVAGITPAPIR